MLQAWENQCHRRKHMDIKLRRLRIRLNRWWTFYRYSGNPNDDPYVLTTRPKNVPLISLRNDEYGDILTGQKYINNQWNDFWNNPSAYTTQEFNKFQNQQQKQHQKKHRQKRKFQRQPLRQLEPIRQYQNIVKPSINSVPIVDDKNAKRDLNFKIYEDDTDNDKENKTDKKTIKKAKKSEKRIKRIFSIVSEKSNGGDSLDDFEKDLLASMITIYDRPELQTCLSQRNNLETSSTYSKTFDEDDELNTSVNVLEDNTSKIEIVGKSCINEISMDNEFDDNSINSNNILDAILTNDKKPNHDVSAFENDRIVLQKQIKQSGLRGWIANRLRPESRAKFSNTSPVNTEQTPSPSRHGILLPSIQHADFFCGSNLVSRDSHITHSRPAVGTIEDPEECQLEKHSKLDQMRIVSQNEIQHGKATFENIRDNARGLLRNRNKSDDDDKNNQKQFSKPRIVSNWRVFSNFSDEKIDELNNSKGNVATLIKVIEYESEKNSAEAEEHDVTQAFEDEYDIFASYEDKENKGKV